MKKVNVFFLLSILPLLLFTNMKCKKDGQDPVDQLPPATQEGKETFGCLVNGEVFVPKGINLGGPSLSSYYQYLNSPTAQGYFFNVSCNRNESGRNRSVSIGADNILIKEGTKYILKNYPNSKEVFASYAIISNGNINEYATKGTYRGELYISRFDDTKQIVSGTFWFDGVNDKGEKAEVREGRFDVHFVK